MASTSRTRARATKAEQSSLTRRRIVEAATDLFVHEGFLTTTMAAIAGKAGVAVQTLYLSFGGKTAILQAAFDTALKGDHGLDGLPDRSWFQEVVAEEDGPTALRLFCAAGRDVIGRSAPLFGVMRAASADPDVADVLARNAALRLESYRTIITALAGRAGFDPALTTDDALTILYTVVSEDSYLLMVGERGWSAGRWATWTTQTCLSQLFPQPAVTTPGPR